MKVAELKAAFEDGHLTKQDYIVKMHDCHQRLFEYAEFIKATDIKNIEISDGLVVMTSRESGVKMVCDPDDHRIAPIEALNFGHYEKEECDMILRLIDEGQTVFDIGGNFGWIALVVAKERAARVLSFEPIPRTFEYLQQNVALNGVDSIELFNFGFSEQEEDLEFFYYPEGSCNASAANLSGSEGVEKITCRVKRLDDFVQERGVGPDFIKCDVEGAELFVFRGGVETLKRDRPVIFAELLRKWAGKFGYHPNEVIDLLKDCGYRCFAVEDGGLREVSKIDDQTVETNFFFLHAEKHSQEISELAKVGWSAVRP